MDFNSEKSLNGTRQNDYPSCAYGAINPYSLYASSLSQNWYAAQTEQPKHYAHATVKHSISPSACSSLVHNVYPNKFETPGNELSGFQSISTALDSTYGLFYGASMASLNPTVQMTTDYTGISDASNPSKCTKQVHPFYWRKRGNSEPAEGMTRTRDKYRVVYTDKQRVGLEKAFKENKFIPLEKKKEISKQLELSERQIKIWFQNRRAKERRQRRKAETEQDETEQDENLIPDVTEREMKDESINTVNVNLQPRDDLSDVGVHLPTHSYPGLYSFEKPYEKRQCRFQPTICNTTCENENVSVKQQDQSRKRLQQDQIGKRLSASPPEWVHSNDVMTACNISPFSANPDFNLLYRT